MAQFRIIAEEGERADSYFYHINDGLHYHFHSESVSTIYFKCVHSSCHGRALYRLGEAFYHTLAHNHPPDPLYTQVLDARRLIVSRARSLHYVSFADILASERRRQRTAIFFVFSCVANAKYLNCVLLLLTVLGFKIGESGRNSLCEGFDLQCKGPGQKYFHLFLKASQSYQKHCKILLGLPLPPLWMKRTPYIQVQPGLKMVRTASFLLVKDVQTI